MFYLHLKSQEPAASRTLLGCQSRLRMVERIGFLMCLLTHLKDACINQQLHKLHCTTTLQEYTGAGVGISPLKFEAHLHQ